MKRVAIAFLMLFCLVSVGQAKTVDGVNMPDTYTAGNNQLVLNGAGIREKWFLNLYIGGLYLPKPSSDAQAIINANEPQVIRLHIISSLISSSKMQSATMEGFENATHGNVAPIKKEVDQFIDFFKEDIDNGDIYDIVYLPGKGVEVYKNKKLVGTINGGMEFKKALFGIWLSDRPAQKDLKEAMLGKQED